MSELINNNQKRKELLKHLILQIHQGKSAEAVKKQLIRLMGKVPYGVVVEAEQELIAEGLPTEEVLKLCDVHGQALKGIIDLADSKPAPEGHPVHTFQQENKLLMSELNSVKNLGEKIKQLPENHDVQEQWLVIHQHINNLMDIDKHYRRKENLLFPYLEKYEITGPPTVMWGKDDEVRQLLKSALESLRSTKNVTASEASAAIDFAILPAINALDEMIYKEEEILFPMCLDTLTELEWYEIYQQSDEIGYCLYEPTKKWEPTDLTPSRRKKAADSRVQLPTGNFSLSELTALFNNLPVDITFVDKEDTVRFYNNNPQRIFDRNRAIIGRKVQMCHPPSSVHIVQQIIDDFRANRESRAAFWITLKGKFIHIEYFALRDAKGEYMGTLEVTQDLTQMRELQGEQRLLNYDQTRISHERQKE